MEPPPAAIICGSTALVTRNMLLTLIVREPVPLLLGGLEERLDDDRAGMVEEHGDGAELAAAPPSTAFVTSSALETSACTKQAVPPARSMSATASTPGLRVDVEDADLGALAAKRREAAPPMPVAPPEIRATLFASLPVTSLSRLELCFDLGDLGLAALDFVTDGRTLEAAALEGEPGDDQQTVEDHRVIDQAGNERVAGNRRHE